MAQIGQKQIIDTRQDSIAIITGLLEGNILIDYYKFDYLFILHSMFAYGYYQHYTLIEMN